ncbi:hypothetical protein JCM9279_005137 [Rhodotorula babjevae]
MRLLSLALGALASLATQALVLDLAADVSAVQDALATPYDYIVVGGGTAGLAVASRLGAGNSSSTILVLEAGGNGQGDPRVDIPGFAGAALGTQYDWGFSTTSQSNANGRSIYWPRGKILGGSSAINFLVSTRPNAAEQDIWASLSGSSAWNWNTLLPYYKAAEKGSSPGPNSQAQVPTWAAASHGTSGPIQTSFAPYMAQSFSAFFQALRARGKPAATDLHSGANAGVNHAPSTINPSTHTRSYSVEYLTLASNVVVVLNAQVTQIDWQTGTTGDVVADGVSLVPTGGGDTLTVVRPSTAPPRSARAVADAPLPLSPTATREVILSAGAVQSPQLLELSGVGNPSILTPLGISTIVDLPAVGENLQDHPAIVDVYRLKPGIPSLDQLSDSAVMGDALAQYAMGQGILTEALFPLAFLRLGDFLNTTERAVVSTLGSQANNPQLNSRQFSASSQMYSANVPVMELLSINVYFGDSRGTIHIDSSNPLSPPAIDPKYLQSPLDTYLLAKAGAYLRRTAAQAKLAAVVASEKEPGLAVQSHDDWMTWVRSTVRTEYHPVGTCSMQPRQYGGVVSPSLKVYGTVNVRVVDVSVVPIHVSSHIQSVAYAIAEKAAALILAGQ